MSGTPTTNYDLPTYADSDAPDLTGAYNAAMTAIDTQMKANADAASAASSAASAAQSTASAAQSTATQAASNIDEINGTIGTMQESIENLQQGNFDPHPESDATLTVQQLSEAKVTTSGIVYFKEAE